MLPNVARLSLRREAPTGGAVAFRQEQKRLMEWMERFMTTPPFSRPPLQELVDEVHALHTKITRGAMLQGKRPWCFRYNGFSACVTSLVIVLPSGSTPWAGTASAQICSGVSAAELTRASLPRAAA